MHMWARSAERPSRPRKQTSDFPEKGEGGGGGENGGGERILKRNWRVGENGLRNGASFLPLRPPFLHERVGFFSFYGESSEVTIRRKRGEVRGQELHYQTELPQERFGNNLRGKTCIFFIPGSKCRMRF